MKPSDPPSEVAVVFVPPPRMWKCASQKMSNLLKVTQVVDQVESEPSQTEFQARSLAAMQRYDGFLVCCLPWLRGSKKLI